MTLNLDQASTGDLAVKNLAGGNIYHGIAPEQILPAILKRLDDQDAEAAADRRDLDADRRNREVRQNYLDRRLDDLAGELLRTRELLSRELLDNRAVLSRMAVALTVQSVALGCLIVGGVGFVVALITRSRAVRLV